MTKRKFKMIIGILNILVISILLNGCRHGTNGMNGTYTVTNDSNDTNLNKNLNYKDGLCPICEAGYRYFYTLSDEKSSVVLFCDECESIWLSSKDTGWDGVISNEKLKKIFNVTNSKELFDESHNRAHYAGWSTMEEIKKSGWASFAKDNTSSIYAITYNLNTEKKYPFSYLYQK